MSSRQTLEDKMINFIGVVMLIGLVLIVCGTLMNIPAFTSLGSGVLFADLFISAAGMCGLYKRGE